MFYVVFIKLSSARCRVLKKAAVAVGAVVDRSDVHVADANVGTAFDVGRHCHSAAISSHALIQQQSRRYLLTYQGIF